MPQQTTTTIESIDNKNLPNNSVVKLLVFPIGKLTLALPVAQVKKVTKYTPIHGSGMSYINLTHIGKQQVTVIDLHQKLFEASQDEIVPEGGYFIITKSRPVTIMKNGEKVTHSSIEESLGIRVAKTPLLIDVTLENIRTLPSSYRYSDTLEIASHVAMVDLEDRVSQTIFILDLDRLF